MCQGEAGLYEIAENNELISVPMGVTTVVTLWYNGIEQRQEQLAEPDGRVCIHAKGKIDKEIKQIF